MLKNYISLPIGIITEVIWAILHLDFQRQIREDIVVLAARRPNAHHSESLCKHDRFIAQQEQLLLSHSVTDDLTAIAYMEKLEPILEGYLAQYHQLQQRHARELAELLESFV